jgi:hypothetical protein
MCLTVGEGPVRGIWQYDLNDGTDNRAGRGRIVGKTSHLDVLRYAAARSQPDPKRVRSSRLRILPLALWMEHQSRNRGPGGASMPIPSPAPGDGRDVMRVRISGFPAR